MSGKGKKVGRDSVEPKHERSEASRASIHRRAEVASKPAGDAHSARATSGGSYGSTESRPTTLREDAPPYRVSTPHSEFRAPRFIDLFCGIGGFRIAFERAGGKCVFSSDWDKFSRQTYAANFGETPHGDIHSVAVADIPKFDILCGGFPCQPFSLAGVSKKNSLGRKHGFQDETPDVPEKYTLTDHLWNYLQNYAKKHQAAGNGFGFGLVTGNDIARTLSARYHKDGSEILISQGPRKNPHPITSCGISFDAPRGTINLGAPRRLANTRAVLRMHRSFRRRPAAATALSAVVRLPNTSCRRR